MIPFKDRVKAVLKEHKISQVKFSEDTGINRENFFNRKTKRKHSRHIYMAIAYYFSMDVEELIADTDAENDWYGDEGI